MTLLLILIVKVGLVDLLKFTVYDVTFKGNSGKGSLAVMKNMKQFDSSLQIHGLLKA